MAYRSTKPEEHMSSSHALSFSQKDGYRNCPYLRNIPFNCETVKTSCLNEIFASVEWWHQLECEDDATKN
ncbi:hypothetical protein Ddye_011745 [Dipteronia dyeriana]|uniref:Uncharacterized protein n=1 Tax=Dipteronia dyeriana TaxID=168575 RepID=A0AAD9X309_9ROSI|nr:hypothetical protein Ddye_011745 [Dipteronia dyeriana]